ncbi:hypothetical protein ASE72_18750 [Sphingomonas sp. Leaf20]|nr:hypothetical protein ASE72_18750 [Sphingomonas sp. Leaf20]
MSPRFQALHFQGMTLRCGLIRCDGLLNFIHVGERQLVPGRDPAPLSNIRRFRQPGIDIRNKASAVLGQPNCRRQSHFTL